MSASVLLFDRPSDPRANSWKKSITLASHVVEPCTPPSATVKELSKLSDHLCYSCLGTFRDRSQSSSITAGQDMWIRFPDYVMESVDQQNPISGVKNLEDMRKMIEGFLIDPDAE